MNKLAAVFNDVVPDAYYVGGVVRSSLLKKYSTDIDLALPKDRVKPAALALGKKLGAAVFEMDAEFGVWRLVTRKENLQIDLSAFQGKNFKEDLLRRDFTVNALAYPVSASPVVDLKVKKGQKALVLLKNLKKARLVDYSNGLSDLRARSIASSNSKVFQEDPLRMLRAFRSSAELNFKITDKTLKQIKKDAPLIAQSAGERIQEELIRLFTTSKAYEKLVQMDQCGLLSALFPDLEDQRTCAEVYYGKGGVLKHTLEVFRRMEYLLANLRKVFPKYYKKLEVVAAAKHLYKMAALLHDIAKPATAKIVGERLRFFYHEEKGAKMAKAALEKLHYSKADIRLISAMIAEHLRPSNLASNDVITDKGAYKFFRDLGDAGVPLLLLCWADYASYVSDAQLRRILPRCAERLMSIEAAKKTENIGKTLRHMQVLNLLLKKYYDQPQKIKPTRLIDGRDIMLAFALPSGPQIGVLLEAVTIAQVEGKVHTKEDGLAFIRHILSEESKSASRK